MRVQKMQLPLRRGRRHNAARPKCQLLEACTWRQPLSCLQRSSGTAALLQLLTTHAPPEKARAPRKSSSQPSSAAATTPPGLKTSWKHMSGGSLRSACAQIDSPVLWLVQPCNGHYFHAHLKKRNELGH